MKPRLVSLPGAILCALASQGLAKEQEFRLVRPDAQSVALVGEFNQWHGYQPQVSEALRWFAAETSSSPSSVRKSEFDKIFKKKP